MFLIGRFKHLIFILTVIFIMLFFRWNGRISLLENVLYGINKNAKGMFYETLLPYGETETSKKRVMELEAERDRLEYKISRLRDETAKLRAQSGMEESEVADNGITARIIGRVPGTWHNEIVAAAGSSYGVAENSIVLSGGGLMGKVIRTGAGTCVIKMITAPGASVSAVVEGKEIFGIIHGNGNGTLFLESVAADADIKQGDNVISSGLGGLYPYGINIGTVKSVSKKDDMLSPTIEITPAAPMNKIIYVVIFKN